MTAEELYEIVKDVPREAWPKLLEWDGQCFEDKSVGCWPSDAIVEAAFVGSMTAWLPIGIVVAKCEGHECPDGSDATHMVYDVTDTDCFSEWLGSSLVAALAAACKEATK